MIASKITRQALLPSSNLFLSILVPAFNEAEIIEESVQRIYQYMKRFEDEYDWELIVVNDGSGDKTGELADALAAKKENMRVIHHKINRNLGGALQTGFRNCRGYYIIVLDVDLSYDPEHIERMLTEAVETDADIVVASPYMKGGKCTKIPTKRLILSKTVNWLMRMVSPVKLHTFTGMVRIYKREFLQYLNLKSTTYSINPEIIHKASILRGRIKEVPAHLDWSLQKKVVRRTSSIKIFTGIFAGFMNSFIFRPYAFFMILGTVLLVISIYVIAWIFINTFNILPEFMPKATDFENAFTLSVAEVFRQRAYSFFVGGTTLIIAIQLLSLGFLSLQSKRYFDELYFLGSSVFKQVNKNRISNSDLSSNK